MIIKGLQKLTLIDYPEKIACSIFLFGCNFKCGYCHNPELVLDKKGGNYNIEEISKFLEKRKKFLDGVCISGGEPTLNLDLGFLERIKNMGYSIKLDTNGSDYATLLDLKKQRLIDYVAMDIKGPPGLYTKIVGKNIDLRDDVEKGMVLTTQFPDYEFRTTIVPIIRENEKISFMTLKEIEETAEWVIKTTGNNEHKYYLQPFVPRKGKLINPKFEEFVETPIKLLEEMKKNITKYLPNCKIR